MDPGTIDDAVRGGDVDDLLRLVDACCETRDWEALTSIWARCDRAHETGHQLWPVASHAAYRLALEAPAPFAAAVLVDGAGHFAPGPLPEVAAQGHSWAELASEVAPGVPAVLTAHERAVRGEDLSGVVAPGPPVLDVPLTLAGWEPRYALAHYEDHAATFPAPATPALAALGLPEPPEPLSPDEATVALRDLVRVWVDESNGRAEATVVSGGLTDAIAVLADGGARAAQVTPAVALAHLAWAGASGGAHGRRPGAAAGRFAAWWAAGALTGLLDPWPPDPEVLGARIDDLEWACWEPEAAPTGWWIGVAVADPRRGRSWALRALDSR